MRAIRADFGFSALLILLTAVAFTVTARGETLNTADRISLDSQGQHSGQFSAPDLTVNYTYARTGGDMTLAGSVQFGMPIQANYAVVQTFRLGLALADAQGNVIGQQGLTSAFDSDVGDALSFSTTVAVPPQTAFMAFTYTGEAYAADPGDPDPTNFWFYPISD
ncbi:MAG: hypothetical protein ABSE08_10795 [Syntrophobacteraceae bacterium]|jgi:hypothetical protein